MISTRKILSGSSLLVVGHLLSSLCSFVRNVLIARFLSVEDFGIAATFALSLAMVEMSSHLALDKILVQRKDGDSQTLLDSAHLMSVVRGFILGVVLFLSAWPLAYTFGLTEITWAFQLLALGPVFKGFVHLDYAVAQRELVLKPTFVYEVVPQLIATAMLYPLLHIFADFRAVLATVMFIPLLATMTSHLQAKRRFRLNIDKKVFTEILAFSWPLMVSGVLMFFIFQGDRLLVGGGYSMETLGFYSAAFSLLMLPTLIIQRVLNTVVLPLLASKRDSKTEYTDIVHNIIPLNFLIAGLLVVVYLSMGVWGFLLVFGEKYMPAITLLYWLGCMQALRAARSVPSIVAMSLGNTKNDMYANLSRSVALLLGLLVIHLDLSVVWIAVSGLVGEIVAVAVSYYLVKESVKESIGSRAVFSFSFGLLLLISICLSFVTTQATVIGFFEQLIRFAFGLITLSAVSLICYVFAGINFRSRDHS